MTKLLVVIVNWQRPADTIECIGSLRKAGLNSGDILLVDNGSQDSSVQQIQAAHPGICIKQLPRNLGYAGGYNAGIDMALQTDVSHVFLLNNDTTVDPQAITTLLDSGWDVSIPKILFYDRPERIWAAGGRWRKFPPGVLMNGYLRPDGPEYDRPMPLTYATGCAIMAERRVFEDIGGFDPDFENYMEDYDLFFHIQKAGFRTGYVPQARIYHKVSATLGHASPRRYYYLGRNTVLFYRKDKRFSAWTLGSYLAWFTLREAIKMNASSLPGFWKGVKDGMARVRGRK